MTTIPNPLDAQHEELVIARLARDMALSELDEIATALYVRANITVTTDVIDAVNELLDDWEELYAEKAKAEWKATDSDKLKELRERLESHKLQLATPDEMRKRFMGGDNGQ